MLCTISVQVSTGTVAVRYSLHVPTSSFRATYCVAHENLSVCNISPYLISSQCFSTSNIFNQFITIIALIRFPFKSTCLHPRQHLTRFLS